MAADTTRGPALAGRPGRKAWLTRIGLLAVGVIAGVLIIRLIGRIDWPTVGDALALLAWWQPLVLVAVLLVRQVLNALPLALYIEGVSVRRATQNDLAGTLMAAIAPPPSDLALRLAMFTSWGVPTAKAVAGAVMNMLTFYIVRFATPLLGFLLLLVVGGPVGLRWLDLISILLAAVMLAAVLVVVRSERLAGLAGRRAALAARLVRRSAPPDPEAWGQSCRAFRHDIAGRFDRGFPRSTLGLVAMLAVDLTLLTCCLRFVGVSSAEVPVIDIAIAYLFAYPLTVLPMMGIGVVDALIAAALVESGGLAVEAPAVAALIVWRVFTIAGPIALGAVALATWRRAGGRPT